MLRNINIANVIKFLASPLVRERSTVQSCPAAPVFQRVSQSSGLEKTSEIPEQIAKRAAHSCKIRGAISTQPCPKTWHEADTDNGAGSSPPPHRSIADPAQVAALLQIGRESASGRRGSIKAMRMAGADPAVFETAIRALHAQIPFLTRWWRGYGESATAPFDHILIELCGNLERCDYRDELMIFNQAHWRAVRQQAKITQAKSRRRQV